MKKLIVLILLLVAAPLLWILGKEQERFEMDTWKLGK